MKVRGATWKLRCGPGYRGTHPRRHRGERQGHGVGQAHGAAVEGVLGIRAEGGGEVSAPVSDELERATLV